MSVRRSLPIVLAIALLSVVILFSGGHQGQTLTFLAVGQGDCIVWQDDDITILVDVGPKTREGFDAGERIVLPKLRKMGVTSIDAILITHPDADHIGGLRAVMRRFGRAKVVANKVFRTHPAMVDGLQGAGVRVEDVAWISGRTQLSLSNSKMEIAAPTLPAETNDNEGSLFVRIESNASSVVLTGDASIATENAMQRSLRWTAQVLKAGHHGSRTSTSEAFARSVAPKWAVISCGRENRFGHPHPSVMEVLQAQSIRILRTDQDGDVRFEAGPKGFQPLGR